MSFKTPFTNHEKQHDPDVVAFWTAHSDEALSGLAGIESNALADRNATSTERVVAHGGTAVQNVLQEQPPVVPVTPIAPVAPAVPEAPTTPVLQDGQLDVEAIRAGLNTIPRETLLPEEIERKRSDYDLAA